MEKKDVQINFVISKDELTAFDAWRFSRHIGSRGEAIRSVMAAAVARNDPAPPPGPDMRKKGAEG